VPQLHANSGAAANIGAATAILGATHFGAPISTTQAAATSVVGAGVSSGEGANWRVVGRMVLAWVVTVPVAAVVAFVMSKFTELPTMLAWIACGGVFIAFADWAIWAMLHTIHAADVEAELLPESVLEEPLPAKPHLSGHAPVE
jgi:inorganic phosphate transporter, PiT family